MIVVGEVFLDFLILGSSFDYHSNDDLCFKTYNFYEREFLT